MEQAWGSECPGGQGWGCQGLSSCPDGGHPSLPTCFTLYDAGGPGAGPGADLPTCPDTSLSPSRPCQRGSRPLLLSGQNPRSPGPTSHGRRPEDGPPAGGGCAASASGLTWQALPGRQKTSAAQARLLGWAVGGPRPVSLLGPRGEGLLGGGEGLLCKFVNKAQCSLQLCLTRVPSVLMPKIPSRPLTWERH